MPAKHTPTELGDGPDRTVSNKHLMFRLRPYGVEPRGDGSPPPMPDSKRSRARARVNRTRKAA